MILIAHRGLTDGPDPKLENRPAKIINSLRSGFDCEIDLWMVNDVLYLGHDAPTYIIEEHFLNNPGLWIHAKNLSALIWLITTNLNYFWHQNDDYVITSHHYIWAYPGKELTDRSICVMPEWADPNFQKINKNCYGICSDYVTNIKI